MSNHRPPFDHHWWTPPLGPDNQRLNLLLVLLVLAWSLGGTTPCWPQSSSIHQQQWLRWSLQEVPVPLPPPGPIQPGTRDPKGNQLALTHEILGFHPYWMGNDYLGYRWDLLTSVAFFALEMGPDGSLIENHGWPWSGLIQTAHQNGTRILVTVVNFSGSDLTSLLGSIENRASAVANLAEVVFNTTADGLLIDFENLPANQADNFVSFVGELKQELNGAYLAVTLPAVDRNQSYRGPQLALSCDHLLVMAYNYHFSGSTHSGPVAPLTGWDDFNVEHSLNTVLQQGIPGDSLLLGVPYFGYRWPTSGPEPGAPTTGLGTALSFAQAYPEGLAAGVLPDVEGQTVWYRQPADPWLQTWFDDATSLGWKYDLARQQNLAGVGIWALGYDGQQPELWAALESAFTTPAIALPEAAPFRAGSPYPNPFGSTLILPFQLSQPAELEFLCFDLQGRLVDRLTCQHYPAGAGQLIWSPPAAPSGCLWIQVRTHHHPLWIQKVTHLE